MVVVATLPVGVGVCSALTGSLLTRISTRMLNVPNASRRYHVLCDFIGSAAFHYTRDDAHTTIAIEGVVWALRAVPFCPQDCLRIARVATKNAQNHAQKHARKRGV